MTFQLKPLKTGIAAPLLAASMITMAQADTIRFWTIEEQPERLAVQEKIAADFNAATGHSVEVIPISEKDLATRATAALAAGDLPDVVWHTMSFLAPWTDAGILDPGAASDVVEDLGAGTFAAGPLEIANSDGEYAAVPTDGWTGMIVYRKDLFEENGLEAPNSFANVVAAIETLHNPPEMYAFTTATKIDETYMMQMIEMFALANGYSPINDDGSINEDTGALKELIEFYKATADASPEGELFWKQSRENYFAGTTAMIMWSPFIMDELAGLRDSAPPTINDDPTSRELANKTGFITNFAGPSNPSGAAYADVRYLGITTDANTEVASEFVKFAVSDGYGDLLGMAPEGKFPVRKGDADDASKYEVLWASLPVGVDRKAPLAELYPQDVIDNIVAGLANGDRWGATTGQLSVASKIVNARIMSQVIRKYMDGEISLDEAAAEIIAKHQAL